MNTINNNTTDNTVNNNREKTTSMKTMTSRTLKTLALVAAGSGLFPFASPPPLQAVLNGDQVFAGSSVTVSQTGVHFHIEVHALVVLNQHHPATGPDVHYLIALAALGTSGPLWGNALQTLDQAVFAIQGSPLGAATGPTGFSHGSATISSQPSGTAAIWVDNSAYSSGMEYTIDFDSAYMSGFKLGDLRNLQIQAGFAVEEPSHPGLIDLLDVTSVSIPVNVIPEPSTYALIGGVGAVALAVLGRRRRKG